jgi:hypothetical protein
MKGEVRSKVERTIVGELLSTSLEVDLGGRQCQKGARNERIKTKSKNKSNSFDHSI